MTRLGYFRLPCNYLSQGIPTPLCAHCLKILSVRSQLSAQLGTRKERRRGNSSALSSNYVDAMAAEGVKEHSVSGVMADLRQSNRGAFIPFIMAGDPDLETTEKAIYALDEVGADVIELGIPYSDPLADGPTIQASSLRGLESGTTVEKVLGLVARVSPKLRAPIILFQYYNPILRRGPDDYCRLAKEAGAAGVLVPDLCLEETSVMRAAAERAGLQLTLLVTPTTPQDRMKKIAEASQGFIYLVSVTGVTGGRSANQARVQGLIKLLREVTADNKSVAVGFGVSGATQAMELRKWGAEGVIVGSALVKALGEASSPSQGLDAMTSLAKSIRQAI